MRTRFAFVHVPKSAGSSIKNAVARSCDPATVAPSELERVLFGDFDGFDRMPEHTRATIAVDGAHALAGYDIAMGHFGCSSFAPHFAPDETMTVLREPRSRLLSHYTFWRGWPEHRHADWHPYAASLVAAAATWEEFVTEPALASQTDNLVARMLLAPHPLLPGDGFIDLDDHDRVAEDALAMLERLGFVDVVERGPDLWAGLSSWLDADVRAERTLVTDRAGDVDWHAELTPAAATAVRQASKRAASAGGRPVLAFGGGRANDPACAPRGASRHRASGSVVSSTVTVAAQVAVFPFTSVTVKVRVFGPTWLQLKSSWSMANTRNSSVSASG